MNKKAELTTQQIIILIVAIISFAVILFLLVRLNLGETTSDELCHNSVIQRGSAIVPTETLPLNCNRKYICITKKEGDCKGLTNPERKEVNSLLDIHKNLAEEMSRCWWMFGEGRVYYIGKDITHNNYCSICSQIYFDESLKSFGEFISKDELYEYLANENIDKSNTYLEYLFGSKDLNKLKEEILDKTGVDTFGKIIIEEHYFIVMGITSNVGFKEWVGLGTGTAIGGKIVGAFLVKLTPLFTTNPIGWVAGAVIIGGFAGGSLIAESIDPEIAAITVEGRGIDNKFMAPTIVEAESGKFNALNCEKILTLA